MFKFSKSKDINFANIYNKAENLINSIPAIKKRRRRKRIFKFFKFFSLGIIVFILLFIIIFSSQILNFKNIYQEVWSGKNDLEQAVNLVKRQEFSPAIVLTGRAETKFNNAISNLEEVRENFIFSKLNLGKKQINDVEYLIKTAEILSKAIKTGAVIGERLDNVVTGRIAQSYSKFKLEEKQAILKLIYESGPELTGIKANLDLAYLNLEQVKGNILFWPLKNKIEELKLNLKEGNNLLAKVIPLTDMLPVIAGYPNKSTFLVMFQNSDELRPTGGFLGTYGILEIMSSDIIRFDTHDIYHLDMPVKDRFKVQPPAPLKEHLKLDGWYMRDANWSPDWPESAKQIAWFYEQENKLLPAKNQINNFSGQFSGIIGITPKLVIDLLTLTGPIIYEDIEYNQENFLDLLQYRVTGEGYVDLGVPSWQRKEVIGNILEEIKIRLLDLPASQWVDIIKVIDNNILEKNVLVYFNDSQLQAFAKNLGWAGEVKETSNDYLMVVDANLASFKTDAVMSRSIDYNIEESINGLFAKLSINYKHNGQFDWKTTRYNSYTRIYVPSGSELIKVGGLNKEDVQTKDELGKTYFGAFISIEPGEIKSIYLEYKLPETIKDDIINKDFYQLLIQKQPGNNVESLLVDLNFIQGIKSYSPTGFYLKQDSDSKIRWETDLKTDKGFKVIFD
ncbi:MAG: DUF4012 domain-containing protein [Patescibacteria group bacterium]